MSDDDYEECDACEGNGVLPDGTKCEECDGFGYFETENEEDDDE